MSKGAKIFLADDSAMLRERLKSFLSENNYQVVVEAGSLSEAEGKIECAMKEHINIAIVDGNLGTGPSDGRKLDALLRKRIPGIKIIPFSLNEVDWGDVKTTKGSDLEEILQIIEGWLTGPPR